MSLQRSRWKQAPNAHSCNLNKSLCIVSLCFPIFFFYVLPPWNHHTSKLPTIKSLSQTMLFREPELRHLRSSFQTITASMILGVMQIYMDGPASKGSWLEDLDHATSFLWKKILHVNILLGHLPLM